MKLKIKLRDDDISEIEKILKENLIPVHPRGEFVSGLRQKLGQIKPEPPVLPRGWRTFLVSTAGVFSGLLIVGTLIRLVAGLIGVVNLARQIKTARPKKAASPTPA